MLSFTKPLAKSSFIALHAHYDSLYRLPHLNDNTKHKINVKLNVYPWVKIEWNLIRNENLQFIDDAKKSLVSRTVLTYLIPNLHNTKKKKKKKKRQALQRVLIWYRPNTL